MTRYWTINGRFLTQPVTGVQRYAHEIVLALDRLIRDGHPLARSLDLELVAPSAAEKLPQLEAIRIRRTGPARGHVWEQTVLPLSVRGGLINLCNTAPLSILKKIVCIHDINTRLVPENFSAQFRALYRVLMPAIGYTAEQIVTVSQYSADQLCRFGVASQKKLFVIGNGHEHALRWRPNHTAKTRAAAGPDTIVVFGSGSPNKNVGLLVGMAEKLARANFRLAIAGARDLRVFAAQGDFAASENVVCLGRLSDDEIAALLHDSLCLAFPSLVEGFGLPPLEAMAHGCPVVATDSSCLPEICGDGALYASPTDPSAWFQAFVQIRESPALRASLIERGRQRASHYNWARSAELYLEAMARSDHLGVGSDNSRRLSEAADRPAAA